MLALASVYAAFARNGCGLRGASLTESKGQDMSRRLAVLLMTMAMALVVCSGIALAAVNNCSGGDCLGTPEDDTLNGSVGEDFIHGLGGSDDISGFGGNDVLYAYSGVFDFSGGGNDQLRGGEGNDRMYGDTGNDTLYGDAGVDELLGTGGGEDALDGGEGDDHLAANWLGSRDVIAGGEGADFIEVSDQTKDIVDCGKGRDRVLFDKGIDKVKRCETKNR